VADLRYRSRTSHRRQTRAVDDIDACISPTLPSAIAGTDELRELEVVISAIYWTMIALFPHLILMDKSSTTEPTSSSVPLALMRIPLGVDLSLHAAPGIALVLDFFLFERKYTRYQVARVAPLASVLFGLWYVGWVEYCAIHNGRCTPSLLVSGLLLLITDTVPYPFLEYPYYIRALVYVGAVMCAVLSFRFLNLLHS